MALLLVACLIVLLGCLFCFWNDISHALPAAFRGSGGGSRVPPGYMGLPFIGEMIPFLYYFKFIGRPDDFINAKRQRYGGTQGLYRTHLFGSPGIIASSPEASKFVLRSEANFFLELPVEVVGRNSLVAADGQTHTRIRSFVLKAINQPEALQRIAQMVQPRIILSLQSWAQKGRIIAHKEARKVTFENIGDYFVSMEPGPRLDALDKLYDGMVKGVRSIPLNLPGTSYHYALKCRRKIEAMFKEELEKRKNRVGLERARRDLMDGLMELKDEEGNQLSDEEVIDNISTVLVGGYESTSLSITSAMYQLAKHPDVVRKLQEEHSSTCGMRELITTDDIQKMKYTAKVVEETIRLANVFFVTFRTARNDVHYKGFIIPKGWKVMCWLRYLHTDPDNFDDPLTFNPDRWDEPPRDRSFMAFGGGIRTCPGNMLGRMQIALFIYHLVRGYRWQLVNPQAGLTYLPYQKPSDGGEIIISKLEI